MNRRKCRNSESRKNDTSPAGHATRVHQPKFIIHFSFPLHDLSHPFSFVLASFVRMKLTLRPEWRLRPLSSFLGFVDLKTGVTIALLFAVRQTFLVLMSLLCSYVSWDVKQLLNKVAGVYGLIAVLTGAGGSAAQLSLYIYSVLGLIALAWGLKAVNEVSIPRVLMR